MKKSRRKTSDVPAQQLDPWELTYEDDTACPTDERLAYELLCGADCRLSNGRLGKTYPKPGSAREREARAALARLIRAGSPFPDFIRETLAALFDPASASALVKSHIDRRIEFKRLRPGQHPTRPDVPMWIALHVQIQVRLGVKKEAAVQDAMDKFGLKRRRVLAICREQESLLRDTLS
jgi:hypothetical protein